MAFELKPGQGTLFANDKQGNDKRPDRRGELNIDGTIYELSGWIKEGKNGPWLSLSCKPKEQRENRSDRRQNRRDDDGSVPF